MALVEGQAQFVFALLCNGDPEEMLVTLGYAPVDDFEEPSSEIAGVAFETYEATFLEETSGSYSLVRVDMQLATGDGVISASSTNAPSGGAQGGNPLPPNVAVLVRKNTLAAGRGKHGRMYLPGYPSANPTEAGTLEPGDVAALQAQADEFIEAYDNAALPFPVVNHGPAAALGYHLITTLTVDSRLATQRRRLRP